MLKVNTKKFIADYKALKKKLRLIKILLTDKRYRSKWYEKRDLREPSDEELKKDLMRCEADVRFMESYIERWIIL